MYAACHNPFAADAEQVMEDGLFDFYFLAEQFNDIFLERVSDLSLEGYHNWIAYFTVKNKKEKKAVDDAASGSPARTSSGEGVSGHAVVFK